MESQDQSDTVCGEVWWALKANVHRREDASAVQSSQGGSNMCHTLQWSLTPERNQQKNATQVMLVTPFPHFVSAVALHMARNAKVLQLLKLPIAHGSTILGWLGTTAVQTHYTFKQYRNVPAASILQCSRWKHSPCWLPETTSTHRPGTIVQHQPQ